jgi:hypothetical protein
MSSKKKAPKSNPAKDKRLTVEQHGKMFVDALELMKAIPTGLILAHGGLDPHNLTAADHKKHGAIYFSFKERPKLPFSKKFNDGKAKPQIDHYNRCQTFVEEHFGPIMGTGTTISVEILNTQNRPYNMLPEQFRKAAVVPHGSIVFDIPSELWTKSGFDRLCQKTIAEGFVVVNRETGDRYKLKHENFPSAADPEKKRDGHETQPSVYTDDGLGLCGMGHGYDTATLRMIADGSVEEVIVAKIDVDGTNVNMRALPIKNVINKQMATPFDGDKVMNFYKTTGQGPTYRYTDDLYDPEILGKPLEFQLKFDGETGLVHKDTHGNVHLMVKIQVDVFEIEGKNGTKQWRLGWLN